MDVIKPSMMFRETSIFNLQLLCHEARMAMNSPVIIAGGAVRDTLAGKPVKDIDIFYRIKTPQCIGISSEPTTKGDLEHAEARFEKDCRRFAKELGLFETDYGYKIDFPEPGETDSGVAIKDLCKLATTCLPHPIEIIGIEEDPVDDIHNYDFSVSQCFVTPKTLFMTDQCRIDLFERVIRYMPTNGNTNAAAMQRSKRRLARLREKYADWRYVGVDMLDELEAEDAN